MPAAPDFFPGRQKPVRVQSGDQGTLRKGIQQLLQVPDDGLSIDLVQIKLTKRCLRKNQESCLGCQYGSCQGTVPLILDFLGNIKLFIMGLVIGLDNGHFYRCPGGLPLPVQHE